MELLAEVDEELAEEVELVDELELDESLWPAWK